MLVTSQAAKDDLHKLAAPDAHRFVSCSDVADQPPQKLVCKGATLFLPAWVTTSYKTGNEVDDARSTDFCL